MGTINKRTNGRWTAVTEPVWDEHRGKERRITVGTFDKKKDAAEALRATEQKLAEGTITLAAAEIRKQRLADWLQNDWADLLRDQYEAGVIALRTMQGYLGDVQLYIVPRLGRLRIGDLNADVVHRWLLRLRAKGLSDRSVQKAFRTLYRAMGDTGLPVNPAALPKHRLPRVKTQRPKTRPPLHEVNAFLDHVQECDLPGRSADYPLWRVVAVTGVRRGELCALTWDNVDLDAGTIHIERSLGVDEGKLYAKGTKNQEGNRIIGIDSITMSALRMHRASLRAERLQAGADYDTHPLGLDFVFRWDETGAPVKPDRVTVRFRREWKHFGGQPGVSLQSLRRSHGTELLASNVPITRAAARMGHSPDVFLRLYVRDNDEAARQGAMRELTEELYG